MNALAKIVVTEGFDLGIGFDGDGDRVGVIDETGRLLYGDEILLLFAKEVLKSRPGAKIVGEVKASKVLYDGIRAAGGEAIMTKIGNTYIRAKMDEVGAILGGETSGHIFFADNLGGVDDGIVAGLKMIEILVEISSKGQKISDLVKEIPQVFATHDLKLPIDEADKFAIIDRISAILKQEGRDFIDIDGIRIDTNGGWWMLRASNTSAVLTGRCESDTAVGLESVKKEFLEYVKRGGYSNEVNFDE
jgi:phosphomannomutase